MMETIVTADGKTVGEDDRVFNYYDGEWGTIRGIDAEGWFDHYREDGTRGAVLNGERVCVRIGPNNPWYGKR